MLHTQVSIFLIHDIPMLHYRCICNVGNVPCYRHGVCSHFTNWYRLAAKPPQRAGAASSRGSVVLISLRWYLRYPFAHLSLLLPRLLSWLLQWALRFSVLVCHNSSPQCPLTDAVPDGGGINCLSQLHILKAVMAQLEGNPRPCEVFDLICGSSTGG
jgi:hypothetical protein